MDLSHQVLGQDLSCEPLALKLTGGTHCRQNPLFFLFFYIFRSGPLYSFNINFHLETKKLPNRHNKEFKYCTDAVFLHRITVWEIVDSRAIVPACIFSH